MESTDLKLNEPGTLTRPGPIGRGVRLVFGALCLWYVVGLIGIGDNLLDMNGSIHTTIWNGILPGLFLISYVINIGFSRPWRKWPAIISAAVFLAVATFGYFSTGSAETALLARTIWLWELYVFGHLGLSFFVAAFIGTPGCEMRALHDIYSRLSGRPTKEHHCPVGPLSAIDRWETQR
tara:strand:- start:1598 stop:2134 length:537 start_codon:yes stop_codon:yes gene_type:complete